MCVVYTSNPYLSMYNFNLFLFRNLLFHCPNVYQTSMRLNIRTFFLVLSTLIIVCVVSFWSNCSNQTFDTFSKHVETNYEVSNSFLI